MVLRVLLLVALLGSGGAWAQAAPSAEGALPDHVQGDVGVLADMEQSPIRGERTAVTAYPFAFFDYERFYARIDTFGVKTVHMGYGYLELAARAKFDGYQSAGNGALTGIQGRENSVPLGLGTLQVTPAGGFFIYALHDFNRSRGNLLEVTWVAEADVGRVSFYPEVGFEHYTALYTQYYYGVSSVEAAASGYRAYRPGAVTNPFLCLFVEVPLTPGWEANLYVRRKWLGGAMADSPLVDTRRPDTGFIALTAHFD
jgi:outer membrane protein